MKYNKEENKLNLMMLLEEEGDDAEIDLGTDDAEAGDDGDTEEDGDDEAADDKGDTETEEEEEVEVSPAEETSLKKPIEAQVDAVLADFEMAALKSAQVNEAFSLRFLLSEEAVPEFDVDSFATDVARLIDNYTTLLDIESAIYYRAINMLQTNYGDDFVEAFKEIMHGRYQMDFGDVRSDPVATTAPLALGAGDGGGGGA